MVAVTNEQTGWTGTRTLSPPPLGTSRPNLTADQIARGCVYRFGQVECPVGDDLTLSSHVDGDGVLNINLGTGARNAPHDGTSVNGSWWGSTLGSLFDPAPSSNAPANDQDGNPSPMLAALGAYLRLILGDLWDWLLGAWPWIVAALVALFLILDK